jgi:uncharacterized membrane protein YbhN (UPF0104 family)
VDEAAPRPTTSPDKSREKATSPKTLTPGSATRKLRNGLVSLVILAVLVAALVVAIPGLKGVGHSIRHARTGWIVVGVACEALSNVGYELVVMLVFLEVPRRFAGRLAWSESAFGAAVSIGGVSSVAVGAWVLHTLGIPGKRIAEGSVALFLATSAVNVVVLAVTGLGVAAGIFTGPSNLLLTLLPGGVALLALLSFAVLPTIVARNQPRLSSHRRWATVLRTTAEGVRGARRTLLTTNWLTLGAWVYLLADIAVLWFCLHAVGQSPPFAALILAYQIGYAVNIIPVPGGIGVLDAGLVGTLVLVGVRATPAAGAELVYHAIALWVPALLGTLAFIVLRRQLAKGKVTPRLPPGSPGGDQ